MAFAVEKMWFRRNGQQDEPTLVLSGGGALGALQVGVLRVLMRRGFRPARIVGTSVGALNGAFLAFNPDVSGVERLSEIWRTMEQERFIHFNPVRVAYRLASRQRHLLSNEFLEGLIAEHTPVDDFAATQVPLFITATNLTSGHKHVFSEGAVSQAVLASTAIPGLFAPVEIDGEAYLDGGVLANLDLETAADLGAREILAIDLSHCLDPGQPTNVLDIVTRSVDIMMRERVEHDLALVGKRARITLIQPKISEGPHVGDLSHVSELIEQGEAFGEEAMDQCFDRRGRLRPGVISPSTTVAA